MSQKDYDMKPRWYVVHTYSGYENKVKTDLEKTVKNRELEDYFFDIVVPMEEQIEIKDGKKKANLRKVEAVSNNVVVEQIAEDKKKENKIIVGELELDLDKFETKVRGEIIDLTLREFEVLKFLASQPEQVVTRETLLERVWGYEYYGDIRTVDVTVRRIREKIEKDTSAPKILITKRGVGYYIAKR